MFLENPCSPGNWKLHIRHVSIPRDAHQIVSQGGAIRRMCSRFAVIYHRRLLGALTIPKGTQINRSCRIDEIA